MAHRGADGQGAVLRLDRVEIAHGFHVDQASRADQPLFHEEEKLGAARVENGLVGIRGQEIRRLAQGRGPVEREGTKHDSAFRGLTPNSSSMSPALRSMTPWPSEPRVPRMRPSATTARTLVPSRDDISSVTCMLISAPMAGSRPFACRASRRGGSDDVISTSSGTERRMGPTFWIMRAV